MPRRAALAQVLGVSPWRRGGRPVPLGTDAGRDAPPASQPRSSGRLEREEQGPARTAGFTCASLTARTRHVFRRATGASCGAHPTRLPACKRHVFRRATGASCGAHPARLSGVQSAPSAHTDARKGARYS